MTHDQTRPQVCHLTSDGAMRYSPSALQSEAKRRICKALSLIKAKAMTVSIMSVRPIRKHSSDNDRPSVQHPVIQLYFYSDFSISQFFRCKPQILFSFSDLLIKKRIYHNIPGLGVCSGSFLQNENPSLILFWSTKHRITTNHASTHPVTTSHQLPFNLFTEK